MKVTTRLGVVLGANIVLLGALLLQHAHTIRETVGGARELAESTALLERSAATRRRLLSQLEENIAKYRVTLDAGYAERFATARREYQAALEEMSQLVLDAPERSAAIALVREWETFEQAAGAAPLGPGKPARFDALLNQLDTLRARSTALGTANQEALTSRLEAMVTAADRATWTSWLAAGGAILLSLASATWLVRSISEPLNALEEGTRLVAAGRFDHRVEGGRRDEFGEVAAAFNAMTHRLNELDRMKRDFVSNLSHDLKTPLASMRETTNVLLDELAGPLVPTQRRMLTLQEESGARLAHMLGKLLELSSLDAAPPLAFDAIALGPLLDGAIAQAAPLAQARAVALTLEALPTRVTCDPERVRQLADNLLENAISFAPPGSVVELRAHLDGADGWCLVCADRGPGVAEEDRERIFDRFVQTEGGRSRPGRGVGLGLTICREIVEAHGGTIHLEPREHGGSRVVAWFPIAVGAATQTAGVA